MFLRTAVLFIDIGTRVCEFGSRRTFSRMGQRCLHSKTSFAMNATVLQNICIQMVLQHSTACFSFRAIWEISLALILNSERILRRYSRLHILLGIATRPFFGGPTFSITRLCRKYRLRALPLIHLTIFAAYVCLKFGLWRQRYSLLQRHLENGDHYAQWETVVLQFTLQDVFFIFFSIASFIIIEIF